MNMFRFRSTSWLIFAITLALLGCENSSAPSDYVYVPTQTIIEHYESRPSTVWPTGTYVVDSARIEGDRLYVDVSCTAGTPPAFTLIVWNYWADTSPIQADSYLSYRQSTNDTTVKQFRMIYDLTPIKKAYLRGYRTIPGVIQINIERYREGDLGLWYEF
jgi:hypothetical protein